MEVGDGDERQSRSSSDGDEFKHDGPENVPSARQSFHVQEPSRQGERQEAGDDERGHAFLVTLSFEQLVRHKPAARYKVSNAACSRKQEQNTSGQR